MHSVKESGRCVWNILDGKKVPILRGKINLAFFLIFPSVLYVFLAHELKVDLMTFVIFIACTSFSFVASLVLHWKIWDQERYSIFRKIDYAGIFLMIGGCGVPVYNAFMKTDFVVILSISHWIIIFAGVFSSLLFNFGDTSKRARSIVYVFSSVPYYFMIPRMLRPEYYKVVFFLTLGGSFYIAGAFIYGNRFPNLVPGVFEYHELFHIFCLLGFFGISFANFLLCKEQHAPLLNKFLHM